MMISMPGCLEDHGGPLAFGCQPVCDIGRSAMGLMCFDNGDLLY